MNQSRQPQVLRWYHLYYVLALFGLATICFSLFLNQQITSKYNSSIEANRNWTRRLKGLSQLGQLSADVNAPGNEVFASKDVSTERRKLEAALSAMNSKMTDIRREFALPEVHSLSPELSTELSEIERQLTLMSDESNKTLQLFEQGRQVEAAAAMSSMDRAFQSANADLRDMRIQVADLQQGFFDAQSRELENLKSMERIVAAAVVIMIVAVTAYGQKQQQKVLESERKFHAIFENTFQFIGMISPDGTLLEANRTALDFIGAKREDVVGRPFWETPWWTYAVEQQARLKKGIEEAAAGKFVRFETAHENKAGQLVSVDFSLKPVFDENGSVVMLIPEGRDISEKKVAEQRVSEFYSTVSHELRTPLTSIRGSLGLIAGGLVGPISDKAQQLTNIAIEESDRLIRLINDILDLRKIEAGMLELRISKVHPGTLLEKTVSNLKSLADQKGISLTAECRTQQPIDVDEDRITQVLTNLVSNALKFSNRGDGVILRVDEPDQRAIKFSVIDSGPGIKAEDLHKLFGKFQQVDQSDSRKQEGTGLGLSISKAIVEQHGGVIGVDSEVGKGSTFWFELPACGKQT